MNVHYLLKVCAEFSTHKYAAKSTSTTQSDIFSEIASSTINNRLNQIYDADEQQTMYTQISSKSKSKSSSEEMKIQHAWDHYMDVHQGMLRKNECKKKDKCPWVIHVKDHEKSQNKSAQNLLGKCTDRKQLLHVYFYHKDEYDKAKNASARKERYVEDSEESQVILSIDSNMGASINGMPHGLERIDVTSPSIATMHQHQNTGSVHIDYQVSQMLPYGITKMETDVSNMSMSRLKKCGTIY